MNWEKKYYERPVTTVIDVKSAGVICTSIVNMSFGNNNRSGNIDDEDIYEGGIF